MANALVINQQSLLLLIEKLHFNNFAKKQVGELVFILNTLMLNKFPILVSKNVFRNYVFNRIFLGKNAENILLSLYSLRV